jgi:hypothetical protein
MCQLSKKSEEERRPKMRSIRNFAVTAIAATAFAMLPTSVGAQIPIQKIHVTVSEPVEVPNLVLPIGTYVFEALENGRVTRIFNGDETHIYATLLTEPEERQEPAEHSIITLSEAPKGQLQRIDSWFFEGESVGSEFLYASSKPEGVAHDVVVAAEDVGKASAATGRFFRANFLVNLDLILIS